MLFLIPLPSVFDVLFRVLQSIIQICYRKRLFFRLAFRQHHVSMEESMSTIVTNDLYPDTGNLGLILYHDINDLSLFCGDANSQAVIPVNTDGLYEFLTFQALLSLYVLSFVGSAALL